MSKSGTKLDQLDAELSSLSSMSTSPLFFSSSATSSTNIESKHADEEVAILLQHAAHGEYKEVDAILTKNPLLVLGKGSVIDYSGRPHKDRTVFQIVVGAGDFTVKGSENRVIMSGMVEMIKKHFSRLPNKNTDEINAIMKAQFEEQFPVEYKVEDRVKIDSAVLQRTFRTIVKSSDDDCKATIDLEDKIYNILLNEKTPAKNTLLNLTQKVLKSKTNQAFELSFKKLGEHLIETGLVAKSFKFAVFKALYQLRFHLEPKGDQTVGEHFNRHLIIDAINYYLDYFYSFGKNKTKPDNFNSHLREEERRSPKNQITWNKVWGYILRFAPACDAQLITSALWDTFEKGKTGRRSMQFRCGQENYYPLDSNPKWIIGHNVAVDDSGLMLREGSPHHTILKPYCEVQHLRHFFSIAMRDKIASLEGYTAAMKNSSKNTEGTLTDLPTAEMSGDSNHAPRQSKS